MADLPKPVYDSRFTNFYYAQQLRNYCVQFMAIFTDMQVIVGKNDSGSKSQIIHVPIHLGSMDRVVASIKANNTTNTMMHLPIMAANIIGIELALEKMSGTGTHDRHVHLPLGGSLPDDMTVIYRRKQVPYTITFELALLTSNKDQQFQIIEQIGLIFDPLLQLQTDDSAFNASKITMLELKGITMDEQYPPGADKRNILTTFTFESTLYLSAPYDVRTNVIKKIMLRLETVPTYESVHEVLEFVDDRQTPPYEVLFDIDDYNIPPK